MGWVRNKNINGSIPKCDYCCRFLKSKATTLFEHRTRELNDDEALIVHTRDDVLFMCTRCKDKHDNNYYKNIILMD